MRHGDKINNLSRTASHRKALLSGLACQLFTHKRIVTTLAKAKALRPYVEPIITKAKDNTTHQRRIVFSRLQDKNAVKELFDVIGAKISGRQGGYTRIIKLGKRTGDNAELALIELVDYNEIYGKGTAADESTTRRTRRGRGKKAAENKEENVAAAPEAKGKETKVEKSAVPEASEKTEKTQEAEKTPAPKAKSGKEADDLTKIEGIGPKVAETLTEAGIDTFAKIGKSKAEDIKEILDKSEGHFSGQDPTTWPEQAQLAADGKWDELKVLQEKLHGGKE